MVARHSGAVSARARRAIRRVNLAGWSLVVALAVLVEAGVRLFSLEDSIAAPSSTLRALARELSSGALTSEVGATLDAYVQGLALAIACGVALGLCIGGSRPLLDASSVVIEFLRPIPAVALIPLAILAFGLETPMRRFVVAFAAVWPILVNTIYGVRGGDRFLHDVARTSGVTAIGRLVRVTLPAALPSIATGIRVSASLALLVCVTAEFVTGTGGLGAYMHEQQNAFQLPELYAAVVLIGLLGYLINVALRRAERQVVFWAGEERMAGR
jgi:ABC-type nitrate/sulfonate/bicarbonate transport system permease component